jgi:hypothetical protein
MIRKIVVSLLNSTENDYTEEPLEKIGTMGLLHTVEAIG